MLKLHKSIFIHAAPEKVWDTMLNKETYEQWTNAFSPGSTYEGGWNKGDKIRFTSKEADGEQNGMIAQIAESRKPEFVSVHHMGILRNGIEDFDSEEVKKWAPSFENYTFNAKDGGTELLIDMDIEESYEKMFHEMWDEALVLLKGLAEK